MEPLKTSSVREIEFVREYLARDNTVAAMAHLERALKVDDDPSWRSFLGYCIARERGQFRKGIELCMRSLEEQKENHSHYLNLGRIYLLTGNKPEAINILRQGLFFGPSIEIELELQRLGARKKPLLPFLSRNNPVNKYLGMLLRRMRLR